jgi:alpha-tubulin suppressor-like RCC1 family protein
VGGTDWVSATGGLDHTCGLHQDGDVSCWGSNANGQLGLGLDPLVTPLIDVPMRVTIPAAP